MMSLQLQVSPPSVYTGRRVKDPNEITSLIGSPKVGCTDACDSFSFDRRPNLSAEGSGL